MRAPSTGKYETRQQWEKAVLGMDDRGTQRTIIAQLTGVSRGVVQDFLKKKGR